MNDDINTTIRLYIKHYVNNIGGLINYKNIQFSLYYYNYRLYITTIIDNNQMEIAVDNIFGFNTEYTKEEIIVKQYLTDWCIKEYEKEGINIEYEL